MSRRNRDFKEASTLNTYKFMLVGPIFKKLKAGEIELLESNSQQIRAFVIQEWEALKGRARKKSEIKLTKEQEKRVINWFVRQLRKLKNKKEKNQKELSRRPGSFLFG